MSAQHVLVEVKKHIPFRVYVKGPVIELFREMGALIDKTTPIQVTDAFRDNESGEIVCIITHGAHKATAALANLKLDIAHPLYRAIKNYRNEVANALARQGAVDVNRGDFRIGDLYKKK